MGYRGRPMLGRLRIPISHLRLLVNIIVHVHCVCTGEKIQYSHAFFSSSDRKSTLPKPGGGLSSSPPSSMRRAPLPRDLCLDSIGCVCRTHFNPEGYWHSRSRKAQNEQTGRSSSHLWCFLRHWRHPVAPH